MMEKAIEKGDEEELTVKSESSDSRMMNTLLRAKNYFRQTAILRKLIEGIIENAVIQAHNILNIGIWPGSEERINYDPTLFQDSDGLKKESQIGNPFKLIAKKFTINLGLKLIGKFLKSWNLPRNFVKYTIYVGENEDKYSKRYKYNVFIGIPTLLQPMPSENVTAYFTFAIIKWKPEDFPVDFYYRLEGNYFVHRHGNTVKFCIEWVENVLLRKLQMKHRIIQYLQELEQTEINETEETSLQSIIGK